MSGYFWFGSSSKKTSSGKVHDSEDHNMTVDDIYHFFDVIQTHENSYILSVLQQILRKQQDNQHYNTVLGENNIASVLVLSLQYFYQKPQHEKLVLPLLTIMKYMCRYDGKTRDTCIEENLDFLHHAGACVLLPQLLLAFHNTPHYEILERACEVIGFLAVTEEIQSYFGDNGMNDALLQLLSHFSRNNFQSASASSEIDGKIAAVIEKACSALWNLSINDKNEKILGDKGGCELMIALLTHYFDSPQEHDGIVERAVAVIWNLSVWNVNEERLNRGGICVIVNKLFLSYLQKDQFAVIEKISGVAHNIAHNERHREKLGNLGVCDHLVRALTKYFPTTGLLSEEYETFIIEATGAILHLSENEQNVEKLGSAGACEILVRLLHHYLRINEQIVKFICGSLKHLSVIAINIVRITNDQEVLEDLREVQAIYADVNPSIYTYAHDTLDRLQLLQYKQPALTYDPYEDEDYLATW